MSANSSDNNRSCSLLTFLRFGAFFYSQIPIHVLSLPAAGFSPSGSRFCYHVFSTCLSGFVPLYFYLYFLTYKINSYNFAKLLKNNELSKNQ